MNRPLKSTITDILPLLKENNVGSMLWGLVNGKTQTHLPWGFRLENLPYTGVWQHDLFTNAFMSYDKNEIKIIIDLLKY
jgi:beta-mannanase